MYAAQADGVNTFWGTALNQMHHREAAPSDGAPQAAHAADGSSAPAQIVSETTPQPVYAAQADGVNTFWGTALKEMHHQHRKLDGVDEAATLTSTTEGMVEYLEYFEDRAAMEHAVVKLAEQSEASIVRTNPAFFGKPIRRYIYEEILPNSAIFATCHDPKSCDVYDVFPDNATRAGSKCDSRFNDPTKYVHIGGHEANEHVAPRPICHSPPTTTQMVNTLVEFEDRSIQWLIWSCHKHNLRVQMCHVTETTVVDPSAL